MDARICIVEDDQDARFLLEANLTRSGYNLEIFSSGYPILAKEEQWPKLFILDIELPGINGLEICKWIKAQPHTKNIPVLFVSASPGLEILANNVHADAYLPKPIKIPDLLEKINFCLNKAKIADTPQISAVEDIALL